MDELKENLKLAECPFNWNLPDVMESRKSATVIIEELLEKEEEIPEHWLHVCLCITIAYLHYENRDTIKATEVLIKFDNKLNSSTNEFIAKYKPALENVYNASRACLLLTSMLSTTSEIKEFSDKIVRIEDLDLPNQAAMYAIKAYVFSEFGVTGSKAALQYAEEALKRNSKEGDWHFLMGKLIGRARNFTLNHEITAKELFHLKKAYTLSETPYMAVFLGTAIVKRSKSVYLKAANEGKLRDMCVISEIRRLVADAKQLAEFALDKSQNQCPRILTRCAYIYSKLPKSDRKLDTAKELLELSLKLNPKNPMTCKMAGDLCLLGNEPTKYHEALEHYKNAASRNVFSANLFAFDIKVKLKMDLDADSYYPKMLEQYKESNYQILIFIHATAYYMLIAKDLCKAVNYFMKAVELDSSYRQLTEYWVRYVEKTVNLYELISNEVRLAIDSGKFSDTQLDLLKNSCEKIFEIKPELKEIDLIPNKVEDYLQTIQEKKRTNSSDRGRNVKWRRGFRGRNQWR